MKPLILDMQAFGAYAARQHLDFGELKGRKFFLIHGATGAGKTTILDAICYALYGSAASDLRETKALRSDHAAADMLTEVSFVFSLGEAVYKVTRSPRQLRQKKRGGTGFTEQLPEAALWRLEQQQEVLLESKYENVTRKITELLGFQCHQFRQVVLLPQGEFRKLLVAKSDERQQIMQTLFKTEIYERIEEYLKRKAKDKLAEIKSLYEQKNWQLAENGFTALPQLIEAITALTKEAAAAKAALLVKQQEYQAAQQTLNQAKEIANKFSEYQAARQSLTEQQQRQPQFTALAQQLILLEKAAVLVEQEKNVKRLQQEVAKYQAQYQQLSAAAAAAKTASTGAAERFQAVNEQEVQHQQLEIELAQIGQYQEQARLLQIAINEVQTKQKAVEQTKQDLQQTTEKLLKLQTAIADLTNRQQAAANSAALQESYQLQVAAAEQTLNKRQQLLKITASQAVLQKKLSAAENLLAEITKQREAVSQELAKAQQLLMLGQAGLLAQRLQPKMPCPVCGATEHPQIAAVLAALPTEAALQVLQDKVNELAKRQEKQLQLVSGEQSRLAMLNQQIAALQEELGEAAAVAYDSLPEQVNKLRAVYEQSKAAAADAVKLEQKLAEYKAAEQRGLAKQMTDQTACQTAAAVLAAGQAVVSEREQLLPEEYRLAGALPQRLTELTKQIAKLKAAFQKAQQAWQLAKEQVSAADAALTSCQQTMQQLELRFLKEKSAFYKAVQAEGFADFCAYTDLKPTIAQLAERRTALQNFNKNLAVAEEYYQRLALAVQDKTPPDLPSLQQQYTAAAQAQQAAIAEDTKRTMLLAKHKQSLQQLTILEDKLVKMQTENGVLAKLYQVTRGDNKYSMNLQRFVLGSLLERVTEAANIMLKTMSKSRYFLQRTMDVARKGSASGLDLAVFDNNTGVARPVATLSGGETFLASLALALGLADVVQQYAGGIRLDTIFVDEGFGTLDPESLDMAMDTLISLQNSGRLVGIISHVPELKARIDARLEVKIGRHGSIAEFHVG